MGINQSVFQLRFGKFSLVKSVKLRGKNPKWSPIKAYEPKVKAVRVNGQINKVKQL